MQTYKINVKITYRGKPTIDEDITRRAESRQGAVESIFSELCTGLQKIAVNTIRTPQKIILYDKDGIFGTIEIGARK